ncbi:MAG: tetratricopeptide repeat protein [Nanopusillaceae archaeon]
MLEIFTGKVIWQGGENADQALETYRQHPTGLPIPESIFQILHACLQRDPQDRPRDMGVVAEQLQGIYEHLTGQPYPRRRPRSDRALADSLNNRAVSLVDLGKSQEAIKLWDKALQADPQHLESLYNRGLIQWRQGQISDELLVESLRQKAQDFRDWLPTYLVSQVHLERRCPQAIAPLWLDVTAEPNQAAIAEELQQLAERSQTGAYQVLASFPAHDQPVLAVDLSTTHILSGGQDGLVKLWTLSGSLLHSFKGHGDMVTAVCLRPDGKVGYSGGRDGQIRVWDLVKGKLVRVIPAHRNSIHSLQWHPQFLLSGSYDNTLKLWDPETGQEQLRLEGHCWTAVRASEDGRYLYGAGYRRLRSWDRGTREVLTSVELGQTVYQICLDQGAEYGLLVGGHPSINPELGQDLEVWHLLKGKRVRRLRGHGAGVTSAWLSPDHQRAVSAGRDQRLKIWEVGTGRCLCTLAIPSSAYALACQADRVALGLESGAVMVWQLADEAVWLAPMMLSRVQDSQAVVEREAAYDQAIAKAREGLAAGAVLLAAEHIAMARSLVGCRRRAEAMELWQSLYRRLPRERLQDAWLSHSLPLPAVPTALAHTPTQVWIGDENGQIHAWDPQSPQPSRSLQGHTGPITTLAWDGQLLVSGSEDTTLKLWDPQTGQCLHTLVGHSAYITACGVSREAVFSASYHDQTLRRWQRRSGRLEHIYTDRVGVTDLGLSLDQQTLVIGGYELIEVWDVAGGERRLSLPGVQDMIRSVALSSDGRYVVAGGYDASVTLWDLQQQSCVLTLTGHRDWVTRVAISLDGRFAFSASRDRTARLWDLKSGECLQVFAGHQGALMGLALAPDLRWLITAAQDRSVRCWLLDWELTTPPPSWDISPYLRAWGQDPDILGQGLSWAGYGWLTPEQIEQERQRFFSR